MQEKPLTVPANIVLDFQLWPGFGKKEMVITSIVGCVSIAMAIIAVVVFHVNETLCVFAFFGILAFCIMLIQKVENNMAATDYIAVMMRYKKEQQQYFYCYKYFERGADVGKEKG